MQTSVPEADRLVVAFAFPPDVDTSGIMAAKRVFTHGAPVDVIQNDLSPLRPADATLEEICADLVANRARLQAPARFGGWGSVSEFCALGEEQVREWEEQGRRYRSLYTRAHFSASHMLGALLRIDRPDLTWEAEFSDPLSRKVDGRRRRGPVRESPLLDRVRTALADQGLELQEDVTVFELIEMVTYTLATRLIFTNEAQVETALRWSPHSDLTALIETKAEVAHHATLPPPFYRRSDIRLQADPARVSIGYFGNVAAGPGVGTVLTAMSLLPPQLRSRLTLHLFTPRHEPLSSLARDMGIADAVQAQPFVPYLDMLALLRQMDVLLVSDHARPAGQPRNPYLLAKWSDYKGSDTPVWGLVDPGSTLSEQALAHRSPLGHVTATMQVLATLAERGPAELRS